MIGREAVRDDRRCITSMDRLHPSRHSGIDATRHRGPDVVAGQRPRAVQASVRIVVGSKRRDAELEAPRETSFHARRRWEVSADRVSRGLEVCSKSSTGAVFSARLEGAGRSTRSYSRFFTRPPESGRSTVDPAVWTKRIPLSEVF